MKRLSICAAAAGDSPWGQGSTTEPPPTSSMEAAVLGAETCINLWQQGTGHLQEKMPRPLPTHKAHFMLIFLLAIPLAESPKSPHFGPYPEYTSESRGNGFAY